jgi:hypothetical protein
MQGAQDQALQQPIKLIKDKELSQALWIEKT